MERKACDVLLEVTKATDVAASQATAWALLRDVPRLSACIPRVTNLQEVEANRRYTAVVADKLGPFGLQVPVRIEVESVEEPRRIVAQLAGDDSKGQARVRGSLEATIDPASQPDQPGCALRFTMRMEVLGKLATLGAAPMRRRADEIFNEFVRRVQAELGTSTSTSTGTGISPA